MVIIEELASMSEDELEELNKEIIDDEFIKGIFNIIEKEGGVKDGYKHAFRE